MIFDSSCIYIELQLMIPREEEREEKKAKQITSSRLKSKYFLSWMT